MSFEREEAARALHAAEAAADRSATAVGYQRASSHLVLWGVVWLIGYIAGYIRIPHGNVALPALIVLGVIGSFLVGLRARGPGPRRNYAARSLVIALAMVLFSFGVQAITPVSSLVNAEGVVALGIGAIYMVLGISMGWRLSVVGAALMIAVILGFHYAREQFFLWMALAGGGGLILGGLWLRKA